MEAAFAELAADLAAVYRRRDVRANGLLYLRGLLMPQVAGNCWSIAEAVGLHRPHRLHHLLERACWDEDAARDAVRAFLAQHLGTDGGVLIFDEAGQAKKGTATVAVGRRYSGTMGRVTLTRNLPQHAIRARIARHLSWSDWRRRHQARARWHHYRTRLAHIA
jgi:SRSO17 transposase